MSTIGSQTVTVFGIIMRAGKARVATTTFGKDGTDGLGVLALSSVPTPVQGPTVTDFSTYNLADTAAAAYESFIFGVPTTGVPLAVVDQFGVTYNNVRVLGVVPVISALAIPSGYYRLVAQWTLLQT